MITVFGSINVDLVLKTEHLPAPGETVLCPNYEMVAGGKGANQALAAARSGAVVRMVGCVGDDSFKSLALKDLNKAGVELSAIQTTSSPTACAAVMVDEAGENAIVVASGANRDATFDMIPNDAFGPSHFLVLQLEIPHEENWLAVDRASNTGTKIVMSIAPAYPVPDRILDAVDYILVNELEGKTIAAASGMGDIPREELPKSLAARHNSTCIMTLGSAGTIAADCDNTWHVPSLPIDPVVDTTGAGDAFAGCFATAISHGQNMEEALRFAVTGAGLSCALLGAQPSFPTAEEIESARL